MPDADVRRFVQKFAGMTLSGDTREKVVVVAFGGGDNGKTTFVETLQHIHGDDYTSVAPESTIAAKNDRQEGVPNDIARLRGSRLVVVSETSEGARLNEGRVKAMTGRNKISARFMRGEWFDFWPEFKLLVETNHRPMVKGTDNAIWNRLKLVPFTVTIPEDEQDKGLPKAIRSELSGILNWLVAGCLDWLAGGLGEPQAVTDATGEYRGALDVIGDFLSDMCEQSEGRRVAAGDLYRAYKGWVVNVRGEQHPMSMTRFGELMIERGFTRKETNRGRVYHGLTLRLASLFVNDAEKADVA